MTDMIEYALKTSLSYIVVLLFVRSLGRKELAQITLLDFVSVIILGSLTASTLTSRTPDVKTGLTTLAVWGAWIMISNLLSVKKLPARKFLDAEPVMVIHKGKILDTSLAKTCYSINDLLEQLRLKSILDPAEVQVGILEADGQLSILKKSDLQKPAPAAGKFTGKELIIDGQIIDTTLRRAGLTQEWLQYELSKRGIAKADDVILATITPAGKLYIDARDNGLRKR